MTRDIAQEYFEAHAYGRPYLFSQPCNKSIVRRRDEVVALTSDRKDFLRTLFDYSYLIADNTFENGIGCLPDQLIYDISDEARTRFILDVYEQVRAGNINYSHYKSGQYGSVGFDPNFNGIIHPELCIKYFNFAFPYSDDAWRTELKNRRMHTFVPGQWSLSATTGVGAYITHRLLNKVGLPSPDVYLATNDLLIQEFIDGYTIADMVFDEYETLISAGIVTNEILGNILEWFQDENADITNKLKEVIGDTEETWRPDFNRFDVVMGNVMIRRNGLSDPENNYVLIDPIA